MGGICFLINGISYLAVICSLMAMGIVPKPRSASSPQVLTELKEGFTYAFTFRPSGRLSCCSRS